MNKEMLCKQCGSVLSAVTFTCVRGEYCKPLSANQSQDLAGESGKVGKTANLTVAQAKEQLPDVVVNVNGQLLCGSVRGRKLPFAHVWITSPDSLLGVGTLEYTWEAITSSLNNGRPLQV